MKTQKLILIGCASLAVFGLLLSIFVGLFFWHVAQDPEGLVMELDVPATVQKGEELELRVVVANERSGGDIKISSVDIASAYLDGFTVVDVEPASKTSTVIPIDNSRSYAFDVRVASGQTSTFTFTLRAIRKGRFSGDVDVCEGMRFVTQVADTLVE